MPQAGKPPLHASSHEDGGRDEISLASLSGTPAVLTTHAADYGLHTKVIRKTADETVNNSDTLQNDDELKLAIAANEIWLVRFFLRHVGNTTADIKFAFPVPSGASVSIRSIRANAAGTTMDETANDGTAALDCYGGTSNRIINFDGVVINGATAGYLQLQWAQNTKTVVDTKVLANSCIVATKLA